MTCYKIKKAPPSQTKERKVAATASQVKRAAAKWYKEEKKKHSCNLMPLLVPRYTPVPVMAPSFPPSTPFPHRCPSTLPCTDPYQTLKSNSGCWDGQLAPHCDSRWALLKSREGEKSSSVSVTVGTAAAQRPRWSTRTFIRLLAS